MRQSLSQGFGLVLGAALCKALSFLLGLVLLSALGLLMTGQPWFALLIVVVGLLLYEGLTRLILGRRR